jgi:exodeoxyribonuclease VII large subunit
VADDKRSLTFEFTAPPPPPAPTTAAPAEPPRVLSVGELDRVIKRSLDERFAQPVWVEGEVTGARPAPSGHLYFCLRDEKEEASIDVVMYRANITPRARALVADGARVRMRGKPDYWAPRGKLQFVADRAAPAGRGAILEALERLKTKLHAEGLFAEDRKRPLPAEPRIVGVVTSAGGAAIHAAWRSGAAERESCSRRRSSREPARASPSVARSRSSSG